MSHTPLCARKSMHFVHRYQPWTTPATGTRFGPLNHGARTRLGRATNASLAGTTPANAPGANAEGAATSAASCRPPPARTRPRPTALSSAQSREKETVDVTSGAAAGAAPGCVSPARGMGKRAASAEGARGPREGVYMCKSEGGWKRTRGACMRMGSGAPLSGDVGQLVTPTPARRMSGARVVRVDHLPQPRGRGGERKDASRRQTAWQPASGPAAASMQLSRSRRRRRSSEAARGWGLRRGCMGRAPDVRGAHRFACLRVCGAQRVARGR